MQSPVLLMQIILHLMAEDYMDITSFTMNANRGITLSGNGKIGAGNTRTVTYGGVISGTGNLTKEYPGTLGIIRK